MKKNEMQAIWMDEMLKAVENKVIDGKMVSILFMKVLNENDAHALQLEVEGIEGSSMAIMPVPGHLVEDVMDYIGSRLGESEEFECKNQSVH